MNILVLNSSEKENSTWKITETKLTVIDIKSKIEQTKFNISSQPLRKFSDKGSMSNHDKVYDLIKNACEAEGLIPDNSNDGMKTVEIIEKIYLSAGEY